ncbi:hypothetical protein A2V71_04070 [Candidatus Berkelbacteria bacterium RBG_13_40_8]|uniref:Uncharacterized protein n=1 Tax=Candidatus Berkelbacteria bacterium RBG_13_40_8 TaxID=1797467 RepID=A0A1F5DMB0_9BACT|nr:MAG: hypothetical protein A2V71_04070 [Candidatus Berkelbacteria bacterium RBG_13_40_8]
MSGALCNHQKECIDFKPRSPKPLSIERNLAKQEEERLKLPCFYNYEGKCICSKSSHHRQPVE